jgi:hypothetical protein
MKQNQKQNESEKESGATSVAATPPSRPLPPVGGADVLPSVGAPTPPVDDNPVRPDARKGTRAYAAEVDVAESAARELRASTSFSQILGPKLGTAQQIADAIDFAVQWDAQNKAGAVWKRYTQEQSNLAWSYALAMIDRLRGTFQAVSATDPAVEKEFSNFTKLLAVRHAVAVKGAATKRRIKSGEIVVNKAAKEPPASTKSSSSEVPAATPAPLPAPAGTVPAPVVR